MAVLVTAIQAAMSQNVSESPGLSSFQNRTLTKPPAEMANKATPPGVDGRDKHGHDAYQQPTLEAPSEIF
jgi:hypothetical protein